MITIDELPEIIGHYIVNIRHYKTEKYGVFNLFKRRVACLESVKTGNLTKTTNLMSVIHNEVVGVEGLDYVIVAIRFAKTEGYKLVRGYREV